MRQDPVGHSRGVLLFPRNGWAPSPALWSDGVNREISFSTHVYLYSVAVPIIPLFPVVSTAVPVAGSYRRIRQDRSALQ